MPWYDDRSEITLNEWEEFRWSFPHDVINEVISRLDACLPDWFMPLAWGVVIASDELLQKAGYHLGMPRPRGWIETSPECFLYQDVVDLRTQLRVRECDETSLWAVERLTSPYFEDETLAFLFGTTPVFTRSCQSAMRLAMHCQEHGPPRWLRWAMQPDQGSTRYKAQVQAAQASRQYDLSHAS